MAKKPSAAANAARLEAARVALAPFLAAHTASSVELSEEDGETEVLVRKPWGDPSLILEVPDPPAPLSDALNKLILPERLTAIWHKESKELEVIWTAFKLSPLQKEINGRKFTFIYKEKKHPCRFAASSKELLAIAKQAYPVLTGSSNHRNIQSFTFYSRVKEERRETLSIGEPLSFWIGNLPWKEDHVIELIQNLNFYLSYYDDACSIVVVHPPEESKLTSTKKIRYISGTFPDVIRGEGLDDNLLSFWNAAQTTEPMTRFLLYYRIWHDTIYGQQGF